MDIIKVIIVALVGVMAVAVLKSIKPELALLAGLVTGAIILLMVIGEISGIFEDFKSISEGTGGGSSIFTTILKIVGIGYLTEYSSSICEDYGSQSIAKKVQLAGKVSIFTLAIPIFANIIKTIGSIVQ